MNSAAPPPPGRPSAVTRGIQILERRGIAPESQILTGLVALGLIIIVGVELAPDRTPFTSLMVPLLLGNILLSPRRLPMFVAFIVVLVFLALARQTEPTARIYAAVAIEVLMALIVLVASTRRSRLGVGGAAGESMFVDLRDRISRQTGLDDLPAGWYAESAIESAGGSAFSGDFFVATRPEPWRLEVALVDVSGKGEEAGVRALQLAGSFGGLLGALPPEQFLPAANAYLRRQDWAEGFATAIHLSVDLSSGAYEVRTAGHPPAALRLAGSGKWRTLPTDGPVLGLIDEATFTCASGTLHRADALLLYTDGMVETPRRDIELGIDRLLGEAEQIMRREVSGSTQRLVDALGSRSDDRALVLLTRR
ncbi:PP2C family protein-serine/threonine phosphatase [Nocardioides sp.]|uniref:PP2C family protein-serine/threonine phosphatase n=1 Tax=Nocardioides sp. TaxID=35761 RepID=UPI003563FC55